MDIYQRDIKITKIIEKLCNFQIIITSQYHMERACLMVFRNRNFKIFLTVFLNRT